MLAPDTGNQKSSSLGKIWLTSLKFFAAAYDDSVHCILCYFCSDSLAHSDLSVYKPDTLFVLSNSQLFSCYRPYVRISFLAIELWWLACSLITILHIYCLGLWSERRYTFSVSQRHLSSGISWFIKASVFLSTGGEHAYANLRHWFKYDWRHWSFLWLHITVP